MLQDLQQDIKILKLGLLSLLEGYSDQVWMGKVGEKRTERGKKGVNEFCLPVF